MAKDDATEKGVGCLMVIWTLFVIGPMWFVLIYQLLAASDVQPWVWFLYWAYVPSHVLGQILAGILKLIKDEF